MIKLKLLGIRALCVLNHYGYVEETMQNGGNAISYMDDRLYLSMRGDEHAPSGARVSVSWSGTEPGRAFRLDFRIYAHGEALNVERLPEAIDVDVAPEQNGLYWEVLMSDGDVVLAILDRLLILDDLAAL